MQNGNGLAQMNLDTLYPLVTEAIRRAEALDELGAPGAQTAYRDVSILEEKIAGLLPVSNTEGLIARRGAVRAAISARDFQRAETLASQFVSDARMPTPALAEFERMKTEALSFIARAQKTMAKQYPSAASRYGIGDILNFAQEFRRQGAPLPIS